MKSLFAFITGKRRPEPAPPREVTAAEVEVVIVPLVGERRISASLSHETFGQLHELAWRNRTTVEHLGQLAMERVLLLDTKGEFSIVPEFQPDREIPRA